ncbi:uL30 family ribosomal protein [Candidatus Woesearchaeota archaeon]|nr:uL30 family ribosomal protein [Candidatus Woesearchaeota archaeon]
MSEQKIAAIRIRGNIGAKKPIKDALLMLNLNRTNSCVVVDATDSNRGMIKKVKDYVTYGEIDDETFKAMVEKRGEICLSREKDSKGKIAYSKCITFDGKKYKKRFRLNPPRGGFERKGIKCPFSKGGVLGYRGKDINKLIRRML